MHLRQTISSLLILWKLCSALDAPAPSFTEDAPPTSGLISWALKPASHWTADRQAAATPAHRALPAKPASKPLTKPAAGLLTKPASKPLPKPPAGLLTKPASKPLTKPAAGLLTKPASKPLTKPPAGLLTKPASRRTASNPRAQSVISHWTPDLIAAARPRDLALNQSGSLAPIPLSDTEVANGEWESNWGGPVQRAAGRIYFEMNGAGYVCSGTVATDQPGNDRSIIVTAAHCLYDETDGFANNVLFIPNQAGTTGAGTDSNCDNDPLGCWAPAFAVADADWADRSWPSNIPWDYGFYVVASQGAHAGPDGVPDSLEEAAGAIRVSFEPPPAEFTHGLGYSFAHDPNFMFCAEQLGSEAEFGSHFLAGCGLSGGASGGPWLQGNASDHWLVSVNSWGYSGAPGMGGPRLDSGNNGHAAGLFALAKCAADPGESHGLIWKPWMGMVDPCDAAAPPSGTPTPSPTADPDCQDVGLQDGSGWHDSDGPEYDCGWYANGDNCQQYGDSYANQGLTANQACCACGGGGAQTTEPPTGLPSEAPTNDPTDPPTELPTANPTADPPAETPAAMVARMAELMEQMTAAWNRFSQATEGRFEGAHPHTKAKVQKKVQQLNNKFRKWRAAVQL